MNNKIYVRMSRNEFACLFYAVTNKPFGLLSGDDRLHYLDVCKSKLGFTTIEKFCKSTITLLFTDDKVFTDFIVYCRHYVHPHIADGFIVKVKECLL